jgi:hypothetical protein
VARVLFGRFEGDVLDDDELDSMIPDADHRYRLRLLPDRDLPARLRGRGLTEVLYMASAIAMCPSKPSDFAIVR